MSGSTTNTRATCSFLFESRRLELSPNTTTSVSSPAYRNIDSCTHTTPSIPARVRTRRYLHYTPLWGGKEVWAGAGKSLENFARDARGYQTHFIAPTLELAKQRMDEGFAFVGITDEWDLSICLFHATFGGKCLPSELHDMRPTNYEVNVERATKVSGIGVPADDPVGQAAALRQLFKDPVDYEMYTHATRRFKADLTKHRVSVPMCAALDCLTPKIEAYFHVTDKKDEVVVPAATSAGR